MECGAGACTSNSLSIANRRGSVQLKRRLPSSINTGTVEKKPRLDPNAIKKKIHQKTKPWEGKNFQLDIEGDGIRTRIVRDIIKLGGSIIDEFGGGDIRPHFVISDSANAKFLEEKKTLSSIALSKFGGILRTAYEKKISVKSAESFLLQIDDFKKKHAAILSPPVAKHSKARVHKLKSPYMKLEDVDQQYIPIYKEFINPTFKKIYMGNAAGKSVFHRATPEDIEKRANRKARKPVARLEYRKGQCEICNVACDNLQQHYATREHVTRVRQPDFYCEVDALCGSFIDEIKVPGCRTWSPRSFTPPRRSPSPSSDVETLSGAATDS